MDSKNNRLSSFLENGQLNTNKSGFHFLNMQFRKFKILRKTPLLHCGYSKCTERQ